MSEYQYIAFRAIDQPVSEKDLEFMRRQSSRAEVTPWSFDNEYHFGDFHGNAAEMLRRGYDLHLHYANFGVRTLMIRLPDGLPDARAAQPYLDDESLTFRKDKTGPGGILCIEPAHEPGDLEELHDIGAMINRLLPLRGEILDGDLRPLYLAHLAVAFDMNHDPEETHDAPVPAGLDQPTAVQSALAELYGLDDSLIAAAAQGAPALPQRDDPANLYTAWLQRLPEATKTAWLAQLMADPLSSVRREMLAEFRKTQGTSTWPTARVERTIAELLTAADTIREVATRRAAEKAVRDRAKKLVAMAADPAKTIAETEKLVEHRTGDAYHKVAALLADLREATAGSAQAGLAEQQAQRLRKRHPTLKLLVSELRRKGFLPK